MAATSLKLPDDLKLRLERLAANARKTPHAFMVDLLAREVERSELRERFAADAAQSEKQAFESGKTYRLADTFDYLERRITGKRTRRPKTRPWRASK